MSLAPHSARMAYTEAMPNGQTFTPAWPLLGGLQVVILVALIAAGWQLTPAAAPSAEELLSQLDIPVALEQVHHAIEEADSGRALTASDEERAITFLTLLGQASGLVVESVALRPGLPEEGLQPIEAHVILRGDPYSLPIFLDGLHRQRAVNHPVAVEGEGGEIGRFSVVVRYYRPVTLPTEWIAERLGEGAPAGSEALLVAAAELAAWRHFQQSERALVARTDRIRAAVARELAAPLIQARRAGARVSWGG